MKTSKTKHLSKADKKAIKQERLLRKSKFNRFPLEQLQFN